MEEEGGIEFWMLIYITAGVLLGYSANTLQGKRFDEQPSRCLTVSRQLSAFTPLPCNQIGALIENKLMRLIQLTLSLTE